MRVEPQDLPLFPPEVRDRWALRVPRDHQGRWGQQAQPVRLVLVAPRARLAQLVQQEQQEVLQGCRVHGSHRCNGCSRYSRRDWSDWSDWLYRGYRSPRSIEREFSSFRLSCSRVRYRTPMALQARGNLAANSNYHFIVVVHGKGSAPSNRSFAFSVGGTSTVSVTSDSSVNESIYYDKPTLLSAHEYTFRAFGTASGGNSGGSLYVTVTDGVGITGTYPMTLTGTCTLQQIEALT